MFSEADIISSGEGEKARLSIKRKTLVSSYAQGVDEFKKRVKYWLKKSSIAYQKEIIIISDGATWIENLVTELLPGCVSILDWFHVKERLWKCAKKLNGEHSAENKIWVKKYADKLWEGEVEAVLTEVWDLAMQTKNQSPLMELHQYFRTRTHRMQYKKFREAGYYIGSGAIESANRYAVQDRLKKAGMKWSTRGANAIAKLRTLYLSDLWQTVWQAA